MDCVFCKIATGQIPTHKVYEDQHVLAFYDLQPQAPIHLLVITREHIPCTSQISSQNSYLVGHIFAVVAKLAQDLSLTDGYRVVNNCGPDGGQTVDHLHFHLLAGRKMLWPPG